MAVGGGVQEKLGADLLHRLDYRPAIHCTGAAIGFLTGEQVRIPMWADRFRLGWLFRCVDEPSKFVPRYWEARRLVGLMLHYHGRLPGSDSTSASSGFSAVSGTGSASFTEASIRPLAARANGSVRNPI
jgi:hypothetical protein